MNKISHASLTDKVEYDEDLGTLVWRITKAKMLAGKPVGSAKYVKGIPYKAVKLNQHSYTLHHVVWFYHKKEWPKYFLEHIDGNTLNNRIENLRDVPIRLHKGNNPRINKTGHTGIRYREDLVDRPWGAYISIRERYIDLGRYATLEEALAAREAAYARKQELYDKHFGGYQWPTNCG